MRILYVDPSLTSPLGHHANVAVNMTAAFRAAGHDVHILGNVSAADNIGTHVERVFRKAIYSHLTFDPAVEGGMTARFWIARYEGEVLMPLAHHKPDLIYAQSIGGFILAGLIRAVDDLYPSGERPGLAVELPFPIDSDSGKAYSRQLRYALQYASRRGLAKTTLLTFNDRTSALLGAAIDWPVETVPSPYLLESAVKGETRGRVAGERLVIGDLGHQIATKGVELVPDVLAAVFAEVPFVEAVVQLRLADSPAVHAALLKLADVTGRVKVEDRELLQSEYEALARSLDIFLLPYNPRRYNSSISGVGYEALSCGSVIVAPADTAVGDVVARYQGTEGLFREWSAVSIAKTLMHVVLNFERLSKIAMAGRARYLAENGPAATANALLAYAAPKSPQAPSVVRARIFTQWAKARQMMTKSVPRFIPR